jgi:hypothetical protein
MTPHRLTLALLQMIGVHSPLSSGRPHRKGTPPPPQANGNPHAPQSIEPPQSSPTIPQYWPAGL